MSLKNKSVVSASLVNDNLSKLNGVFPILTTGSVYFADTDGANFLITTNICSIGEFVTTAGYEEAATNASKAKPIYDVNTGVRYNHNGTAWVASTVNTLWTDFQVGGMLANPRTGITYLYNFIGSIVRM